MRMFLVGFGWASVIGSLFDGAIAAFVGALVALGREPIGLSVDAHLRDHLPFIYWVKDVAYTVLPDGFVTWLFDLPALVYFPVRVAMSVVLGWAAFVFAARLKP